MTSIRKSRSDQNRVPNWGPLRGNGWGEDENSSDPDLIRQMVNLEEALSRERDSRRQLHRLLTYALLGIVVAVPFTFVGFLGLYLSGWELLTFIGFGWLIGFLVSLIARV